MRTVMQQWESYEREVVPKTAGAEQRIESRRAFFAGAQALLNLVSGVGSDDVSENQGVAMLDGLSAELQVFSEAVLAGLA